VSCDVGLGGLLGVGCVRDPASLWPPLFHDMFGGVTLSGACSLDGVL
jgi:hypothetical protein